MARKNRSFLVPSILGLGGVAGMVVSAQASYLTESFDSSTPIPPTSTNWSDQGLAFEQFNPSLGTLESVSLTLVGNVATQLTVKNDSSDPSASGTVSETFNLLVQDAGNYMGMDPVHLDDNFNPQLVYGTNAQNYGPLAIGSTYTAPRKTQNGITSTTVYNPSAYQADGETLIDWTDLQAEFTGSGNITMTALAYAPSSVSSSDSNQDVSQVTTASLTGTVVYTYDPVPEPATMSLVLIGGSIAALRRRRRLMQA